MTNPNRIIAVPAASHSEPQSILGNLGPFMHSGVRSSNQEGDGVDIEEFYSRVLNLHDPTLNNYVGLLSHSLREASYHSRLMKEPLPIVYYTNGQNEPMSVGTISAHGTSTLSMDASHNSFPSNPLMRYALGNFVYGSVINITSDEQIIEIPCVNDKKFKLFSDVSFVDIFDDKFVVHRKPLFDGILIGRRAIIEAGFDEGPAIEQADRLVAKITRQ